MFLLPDPDSKMAGASDGPVAGHREAGKSKNLISALSRKPSKEKFPRPIYKNACPVDCILARLETLTVPLHEP